MEAFEAWFDRNVDNFNAPFHYTELGWKAALSWVLNHPDLNDCYYLDVLDYVEKELKDEKI